MAKVEVKLTDEQVEAIKNYGSQIKTLSSFTEAVRKKPGMYIGHIGLEGFVNMFREVFQNAFDELVRIVSPCDAIWITFDERTCTVIVEDNGRGIPFGNIVRIFNKQHTSTNYEKILGDYTSGTHGVGAKVTNALSTNFIVESYILGEARRVEFNDGIPWNKGELGEVKIPNKDNKQGTMICFNPSFEIMGSFNCDSSVILGLIRSIWPLTKVGSKLYFKSISMAGKETNIIVENEDGIMSYIIDITKAPIIKPITFSADTGEMRANIAFTYDADNVAVPENIISFANFCPTETVRSSHAKGFIAGMRKYFLKYMNDVYLVSGANTKKKNKIKVIESDIRTGIRVALDVAMLEPIFNGQAKEELSSAEMESFVRDLTFNSLDQWAKLNPSALQKLCKYFKDIAEIRCNSDDKKIKLSDQYNSGHNGLPAKYSAPTLWNKYKTNKDYKFELLIVEGDSAGGSAKNYRNNKIQGIMPLRGKMINCFAAQEKKCLENEEVAALLAIWEAGGPGTGKGAFDINKFYWDKIVFEADADPDGAHINSLGLRCVLRFAPDIIRAGKLYKAVPPLYGVKQGKNMTYFSTRIDYVQYMQQEFSKKYVITTLEGKPLTKNQVTDLLYKNIDYIYELKKIGDRYKVDYSLLELYLFNRNESVADIGKLIKKKFRFMQIKSINKTPTAEGIIDEQYNTLFMNKRLIDDSFNIIKIMNNNLYKYYKLNGEVASIYDIMAAYAKSEPSSIVRYKGLGEMDPDELAKSTLLPGDQGQRLLVRYTMEDAIKEINEIRYLESNKNKLLENMNVSRIDVLD